MRALFLVFLLSGCSGMLTRMCEVPEKEIKLEAAYYKECASLPTIPADASFITILENHKNILEVYNTCKLKQHDSVTVLKVLTNHKEDK